MASDPTVWIAILVVAGITFASRLSGALVMSRVPISKTVERFLDGMSVSVIAALAASLLAQGDLRLATAVALAGIVMFGSKQAVWAMLAGMAVAALWSAFLTPWASALL